MTIIITKITITIIIIITSTPVKRYSMISAKLHNLLDFVHSLRLPAARGDRRTFDWNEQRQFYYSLCSKTYNKCFNFTNLLILCFFIDILYLIIYLNLKFVGSYSASRFAIGVCVQGQKV